MIQPPTDLRQFAALLQIVEALRGPNGCPWDKEQTHRSLAPFAIEEAHELAEAVESGVKDDIVAELGDVLLQVALHAEIGRQAGLFNLADVIESISTKMVRRHPHVFAHATAEDSAEVLKNWAEIKKAEKAAQGKAPSHGFDVPVSLPALTRAQKIGGKTKEVRFDWPDWRGVLEKVDEELAELKEACQKGTNGEREHELGDLLFSLAQLARHLGLEAEQCLRTTNARFEHRYVAMRTLIDKDGRDFSALSTAEMDVYWQRVKVAERALGERNEAI